MTKSVSPPKRPLVLFLTGWQSHPLHQGVVQYAKEAGWLLDNSMCFTEEIPENWEGDGILCRHAFKANIIDFCQHATVPMVGFEEDKRLEIPRVYLDQEKIGELAARHLLERGYRRLGFFHLGVAPFQLPRMHAFRRVAEENGAEFFELVPPGKGQWRVTRSYDVGWLKDKLAELDLPVGMMVINDLQAPVLLRALEEMGISVPDRMAVLGAENVELLCEMSTVPLTSVETNDREMGYQAAALLDRLMSGEPAPREVVEIQPGPVVVRKSSDMICVHNEYASTALRFIWEHFREPISVEDVARVVSITRRRLQTVFLEDVGRTLQEEISRVRVEAACRELEAGGRKVREIATLCGFSSSLHMHRAFTGTFGLGPKAYADSGRPEGTPRLPIPFS